VQERARNGAVRFARVNLQQPVRAIEECRLSFAPVNSHRRTERERERGREREGGREREREREGERCVVLVAPPIDDPLLEEARGGGRGAGEGGGEGRGEEYGGESEEARNERAIAAAGEKRGPAPAESRKIENEGKWKGEGSNSARNAREQTQATSRCQPSVSGDRRAKSAVLLSRLYSIADGVAAARRCNVQTCRAVCRRGVLRALACYRTSFQLLRTGQVDTGYPGAHM